MAIRSMFMTPGAAVLAQWATIQGTEQDGMQYATDMLAEYEITNMPTWDELKELAELSSFCGSSEFEDPETGGDHFDLAGDWAREAFPKIMARVEAAAAKGWRFWQYIPGHGYYAVVAMDPRFLIENGPELEDVVPMTDAEEARTFFKDLLTFYTED